MEESKKELLQWHPAFYADLQIELEEDLDNLVFKNEHQLGTMPKEIDVLIIKKQPDKPIQKNIGRIFRKHNIVEYKSPSDNLSIDDFYKVCGYALFYKSDTKIVDEIKIDDITITFACYRFPRELNKHLENHGMEFAQKYSGIYYLQGFPLPVQLLCISQLSENENFWLRSLTNSLRDTTEARQLIQQYKGKQNNNLYISVMDIIVRANQEKFKEEKDMCQALEELMKDKFIEREERGREEGREEGIRAFVEGYMEDEVPKERILTKIIKLFNLTESKALEYYTKFSQ